MSVLIIAEAGVNHNGSLELAKKMVEVAKIAGADCVKFQTYITENIVSKNIGKAHYQKKLTEADESQFSMLKQLELPFADFIELSNYCKEQDIEFLSTAFDLDSIKYLNKIGMKRWKIPSGDITNLPYLIEIAKFGKPILLSTGMSTMEDIDTAISVLKENGSGEITVLHCTTEYPVPFCDVNLSAMNTIRDEFGLPIGYSDHTKGIEVAIAAVALGATVIEKHFTLNNSMNGPDHEASLKPDELKAMIAAIRNIEIALGNGLKKLEESEKGNMVFARKSIVAKTRISKGESFNEENLAIKRPGNGICPMQWFDVLGKKALRNFAEDELIEI